MDVHRARVARGSSAYSLLPNGPAATAAAGGRGTGRCSATAIDETAEDVRRDAAGRSARLHRTRRRHGLRRVAHHRDAALDIAGARAPTPTATRAAARRAARRDADVDPARGLHAARPGRPGARRHAVRAICSTPTQPLTGVRSVSLLGRPIRAAASIRRCLEVDGAPVASIVHRRQRRATACRRSRARCRASRARAATLSFDTAALPDGSHSLRLVITDATGTNSASYGPVQVRTAEPGRRSAIRRSRAAATPVLAAARGDAQEHAHARGRARGDGDRDDRGRGGRRRRQPARARSGAAARRRVVAATAVTGAGRVVLARGAGGAVAAAAGRAPARQSERPLLRLLEGAATSACRRGRR